MRSSIIKSVLCLVGINSPLQCLGDQGVNWKNAKNVHHSQSKFLSRSVEDLDYYTTRMSNEVHFERQLDKILIPRPVGSNNHKFVRQFLAKEMENLGWDIEQHSFNDRTPHGTKRFTNVIATLDPTAPRRMVIACHYDSLLNPEGFLGATDSAVPCAMMLNMAKTMKLELNNLKSHTQNGDGDLTLQFLFFDGEEAFVSWGPKDSIYGSRKLAETWENTTYSHRSVGGNYNDRIDIFILLDLIGATDMAFSNLRGSTRVSTGNWFNRLQSIEKALHERGILNGSKMFTDRNPNAQISDDHKPFQKLNVPILHLISTPFPRNWHKMGDNKKNLDATKIANLNKILRVFVAEYLQLDRYK